MHQYSLSSIIGQFKLKYEDFESIIASYSSKESMCHSPHNSHWIFSSILQSFHYHWNNLNNRYSVLSFWAVYKSQWTPTLFPLLLFCSKTITKIAQYSTFSQLFYVVRILIYHFVFIINIIEKNLTWFILQEDFFIIWRWCYSVVLVSAERKWLIKSYKNFFAICYISYSG